MRDVSSTVASTILEQTSITASSKSMRWPDNIELKIVRKSAGPGIIQENAGKWPWLRSWCGFIAARYRSLDLFAKWVISIKDGAMI